MRKPPASKPPAWTTHLSNRRVLQPAAALAAYAALSGLFIARGSSLNTQVCGAGADPFIFIWSLAWWPWAVTHGANLLHTTLIWQPQGVYLFWVTSIPLLAALAAPITLTAGPLISYNLLVLLAPTLSAWTMFLLCHHLTTHPQPPTLPPASRGAQRRSDPSSAPTAPNSKILPPFLAGYLFGFSTYQMAQSATLNLAFTACLPLAGLIALAHIRSQLPRPAAIALTTLLAVAQFLIATEIFALTILFALLFWLLAFTTLKPYRPHLILLATDSALAALAAAIILSPALISMLSHINFLHLPALWPRFFTADLAATIIPNQGALLGGNTSHLFINPYFGDVSEQDSYIGAPLLIAIYSYARQNLPLAEAKYLVLCFITVTILSWGPALWVFGHYTAIPMPWRLFLHFPLLGDVLPARFALFAAFIAAIFAATWLAQATTPPRLAIIILTIILTLPAPHPSQPVPSSPFFAPNHVQSVLGLNAKILILPFAINGPSSYWQAAQKFTFTQTGGYLGFPPANAQKFPAVQQLFGNQPTDFNPTDFTNFLTATRTQYVIATPATQPALLTKLKQLGWPTKQMDDVMILTVPQNAN